MVPYLSLRPLLMPASSLKLISELSPSSPLKRPMFLCGNRLRSILYRKNPKRTPNGRLLGAANISTEQSLINPLHLRQWVREQGALVRGGTSHTRSVSDVVAGVSTSRRVVARPVLIQLLGRGHITGA